LGVSVGFDFVTVFETLQEKHYAMQHYANLDAEGCNVGNTEETR